MFGYLPQIQRIGCSLIELNQLRNEEHTKLETGNGPIFRNLFWFLDKDCSRWGLSRQNETYKYSRFANFWPGGYLTSDFIQNFFLRLPCLKEDSLTAFFLKKCNSEGIKITAIVVTGIWLLLGKSKFAESTVCVDSPWNSGRRCPWRTWAWGAWTSCRTRSSSSRSRRWRPAPLWQTGSPGAVCPHGRQSRFCRQ